jgi:glyoxylase I family protein
MTTNADKPDMNREFLIDHVAVSVSNLNRSIDFYKQNFGFLRQAIIDAKRLNGKICHLKKGNVIIELFAISDPTLPPDSVHEMKTMGIKHFSLNVTDIIGAFNFLKRNAVDVKSDVIMGQRGLRYFFIKDPDGMEIEVIESTLSIKEFAEKYMAAQIEAWQNGKFDLLEALEDPNAVYHLSFGDVVGWEAHKKDILQRRQRVLELPQWTYLTGEGNVFALSWKVRTISDGERPGIPAGKEIASDRCLLSAERTARLSRRG